MENHIDDSEWLRAQYESGMSLQAIADALGVHRNTVRNRLIQFGVARRSSGDHFRGKPKSSETKAKMAKARLAYWGQHQDRDDFKVKISRSRRKTGVRKDGYRWIYVIGRGRMLEHRFVVEQMLGRRLESDEIVHHKDGDKLNNHPDNLELTSSSGHIAIHHKQGDIARPIPRRPPWAAWASATHKECRGCKAVKPRSDFSPKRNQGGDPHASQCKACCAAARKAKRQCPST